MKTSRTLCAILAILLQTLRHASAEGVTPIRNLEIYGNIAHYHGDGLEITGTNDAQSLDLRAGISTNWPARILLEGRSSPGFKGNVYVRASELGGDIIFYSLGNPRFTIKEEGHADFHGNSISNVLDLQFSDGTALSTLTNRIIQAYDAGTNWVASAAHAITSTMVSNWNAAYSAGTNWYASVAFRITAANTNDWSGAVITANAALPRTATNGWEVGSHATFIAAPAVTNIARLVLAPFTNSIDTAVQPADDWTSTVRGMLSITLTNYVTQAYIAGTNWTASTARTITSAMVGNWNSAYSAGTNWTASVARRITVANTNSWSGAVITANAAMPKAGGNMTGSVGMGGNVVTNFRVNVVRTASTNYNLAINQSGSLFVYTNTASNSRFNLPTNVAAANLGLWYRIANVTTNRALTVYAGENSIDGTLVDGYASVSMVSTGYSFASIYLLDKASPARWGTADKQGTWGYTRAAIPESPPQYSALIGYSAIVGNFTATYQGMYGGKPWYEGGANYIYYTNGYYYISGNLGDPEPGPSARTDRDWDNLNVLWEDYNTMGVTLWTMYAVLDVTGDGNHPTGGSPNGRYAFKDYYDGPEAGNYYPRYTNATFEIYSDMVDNAAFILNVPGAADQFSNNFVAGDMQVLPTNSTFAAQSTATGSAVVTFKPME